MTWRGASLSCCLLILAATARASDPEPTAAPFLDIDVNARSAAMAGTGLATVNGLQSVYSNPAGLAGLVGQRAGFLHAAWFEGLSIEWAGYATEVGPRSALGVGLTFLRSDPLTRYDELGEPDGEFRVYDAALALAYGYRPWERSRVGVTLKGIHQNVDDVSGSGVAADLGFAAEIGPATVAAVVGNVGPDISIGGDGYPMPTAFALGGSAPLWRQRVLLSGTFTHPLHYYDDFRIGLEFRPTSIAALRAGYRQVFDDGTDDQLSEFSWGFGFLAAGMQIDYAYQPFDQLGDTHRFGLTVAFDRGIHRRPDPLSVSAERRSDASRDAAPVPPADPGPPLEPESAAVTPSPDGARVTTPVAGDDPPAPRGVEAVHDPAAAPTSGRAPEVGSEKAAPAVTEKHSPAPTEKAPAVVEESQSATPTEKAPPASSEAPPPASDDSSNPADDQAQGAGSGPVIVVAGTHPSRFAALEELRLLRVGGYRGGEVERLDDGRYRVVVSSFPGVSDAAQWIQSTGGKYGKFDFRIVRRP